MLSIISLASTCQIYEEVNNDRATGVCYNNIANLHLKNGKFNSAALSFEEAIARVKKLIEDNRSAEP